MSITVHIHTAQSVGAVSDLTTRAAFMIGSPGAAVTHRRVYKALPGSRGDRSPKLLQHEPYTVLRAALSTPRANRSQPLVPGAHSTGLYDPARALRCLGAVVPAPA